MTNAGIKHHAFAFFDESGKFADCEVVALAGIVGTSVPLGQFAYSWNTRLQRDGLEHVSMKDALHLNDDFHRWRDSPERRDTLLLDLASIIHASPLMRTGAYVTSAEFKALSQSERKLYMGDPQYCCLETCVLGILAGRDDFSLNIACDLSEQYSEKCVALFHKLRSRNPVVKSRCFGISFLDDRYNPPLQAADMIAYCSRAERLEDRSGEQPIVTRLIDMFASQDRRLGKLTYRVGSLGLGDSEFELEGVEGGEGNRGEGKA